MENGTIVYADSIMSALKMSNKQLAEDIIKAFDDKIENFLGFILEISTSFEKFELLTVDGEYYVKRDREPKDISWLSSGLDWKLESCRPVSYSFDIKDNNFLIIDNLGFSTRPSEICLNSIEIEGDIYRIMRK